MVETEIVKAAFDTMPMLRCSDRTNKSVFEGIPLLLCAVSYTLLITLLCAVCATVV